MAAQPVDLGRASFVNGVAGAVLAGLVVAALYYGKEIFIALALAVMLSFVLAPLANILEDHIKLPRGISVPFVVMIAFAIIFALGGVIANQATQLTAELPRYEQNIREKIKFFRKGSVEKGTLERAADVIQGLGRELEGQNQPQTTAPGRTESNSPAAHPPEVQTPPPPPRAEQKPIPVEIREPAATGFANLKALISPLLHPLAMTGITVIFVIFILLQREDLRNRFIKLAGSGDINRATRALDDAGRRLSKLFLIQLLLNAAFGVVIGAGLWLIGVPSAPLWGILAGVLRFVPYIGAFISAIFPMALAAAVDPGWSMLIWAAALFIVLEPLVGHGIEPILYGHSSGLSPVAVVMAATFWTALWGPVGLILATPLTICLVVLGRHVESMKFLDVMLGDRPALSQPEMFYQRMLANDPDEVAENAEKFLENRPLSAFYDEVAIKGLRLAERDHVRGSLRDDEMERIRSAMALVIEDLVDEEDSLAEIDAKKKAKTVPKGTIDEQKAAEEAARVDSEIADIAVLLPEEIREDWSGERVVLCIAERTALDAAAGAMLVQLLAKHGLKAVNEGDGAASTNVLHVDPTGVKAIVVSCLNTTSLARIRHAVRRVRRRAPSASIILGCWDCDPDIDRKMIETSAKPDHFVATLRDCVAILVEKANRAGNEAEQPALHEPERLSA